MNIRRGVNGLTLDDILAFDDEVITEAILIPEAPRLALKVFKFIRDNDNLVTVAGGMEHHITGLDRFKLIHVAKKCYNINLSKYMFAVDLYERLLVRLSNDKR